MVRFAPLMAVLLAACGSKVDIVPPPTGTLAQPTDGTGTATGNGTGGGGATGTGTGTGGADSDGDGLSDADELALGSDPDLADTDGDGWDDGEEVDGNTDPTLASDHPYAGGWPIDDCRDGISPTGNGVGQVADDFALMDQNGETVHLHDFCGQEVLLVSAAFW